MPIDSASAGGDAEYSQLHRMENSIGEINARIARLAIALGVSLQSDADVVSVINRPKVPSLANDRRVTQDRRANTRVSTTSERRVAYQWEELRGLLVLRYGLEESFVDQVGVMATEHILIEAEHNLERRGFKPGADGVDLNRLFDGS